MPKYVVRLVGKLNPPLTIDCTGFTVKLPSFSVTVEKETLKAEPHTNIQLEALVARERLQQEITPLLTVFGFTEERAISLTVTDIIYPNFGTATRSIATRFVLREQPPTKDEVLVKYTWATADPIYRDLLDFYIEALGASNPRPIGAKLIERLKVKFNGYDMALTELGLPEDSFNLIKKEQSKYKGDRHADYKVDDIPKELNLSQRNEILALLRRIIDQYEKHVCASLP